MDTPREPETTLAQRTVSKVRDGLASGRLPVVPQILELIRVIASRSDSISIQQLADIIGQDPGTMARVISIANKLAYNPAGAEIATIHQAISIIGFERIRNLSISVMLAENAESQLSADENREVAGLALASGFLAQELLLRSGVIDPEVAFVCAALRNYGKLMLTTFLLEDYERARSLAPAMGTEKAFREVFGITPLELGRELLESEQLPAIILESLRKVSLPEVRKQTLSPLEQLTAAAEFSVRLFELFEDPLLTAESFTPKALRLAEECVPSLRLSSTSIQLHLGQVHERCREVAATAGNRASNVPLFRRVEALVENRQLPPPSTLARRLHAQTAASAARQAVADALQSGATTIAHLLQREPDNLEAPFGILLEVLHDNLRLRQSVVFLANPGTATCSAHHGRGQVFDVIRGKPMISRSNRDVFGLCLQRGEDILLQDPENPKVRTFIPPWLLAVAQGNSLVLLALRDREGTYGIILAILQDREALAVIETVRSDLVSLRSAIARVGPKVRQHHPHAAPL